MYGTLISLFLAIFLWFNPAIIMESPAYLAATIFSVGVIFIITQIAITIAAWGPLQKTMQNITPRLIEAFKSDGKLGLSKFILILFFFLTYLITLDLLVFHQFNEQLLIILWTLILGVATDALYYHLKRVMDYMDSFHIVNYYTDLAKDCLVETKETELCGWIDTIAETSVKGITRNNTSLAMHAAEKLRVIAQNYLIVAKGITYHGDEDAKKFGGVDHVSYILFYIFQRLEMIFEQALKGSQEPVCSKIITVLGKICIDGAKFDITVAGYPLHYLGKFTLKAQQEVMQEVGNRATLTLLEVSRVIIKEVDLQYVEIKETFLSILTIMHEVAKNTFRNDKRINIQILLQPLYQLKELFQMEKMINHQDTEVIVRNINVVIDEFNALESVMSTLPPIPEMVKEREAAEEKPQE